MDGEEINHVEVSYKLLQDHINKLTENQTNIISKFEVLNKNVDELRKTLAQFSDKINTLEEVSMDRKKLKIEIKILKNRIDELYAIVKEGKEDDSNPSADPQEVESCHSGFSCSSKVLLMTLFRRIIFECKLQMGDEMSKRKKFLFVTWVGPNVSVINRAKMSTDKAIIKDIISRLQMGDEMSKRKKFLFVTWVGPNVSVINRAKMSTDKAIIKDIISNFAVELQLENQSEIDIDQFKDALNRAGGANYGTGVRDL
ncbi:uncharacterized protein LOC118277566 [Spodoptera frugiperda]|uniref:Coactosin-like protein n=1 Tax=Spodoptera frugiperda TaxID=7108 RepID=A0A9R0EY53_SPOFR|nr:uncharacterized protein LOC118277566 [Spodoptera frugiperda]